MTSLTKMKILPAAALLCGAMVSGQSAATPGQGFAPAPVVNGHFGSIMESTDKTDKWDMFVKTKGDTDVGADRLSVAPGGYSGWHTHPAPLFVTVVSGSIVWYDGSYATCSPHTYSAGQSFIEPEGRVHYVRNASTTESAEFIAVRMNPTGVPFRQDQPKPSGCNF